MRGNTGTGSIDIGVKYKSGKLNREVNRMKQKQIGVKT